MEPSGKPRTKVHTTAWTDEAVHEAWAVQARPLRECGDIAATRLSGALSAALKQAAEQLTAKGSQGGLALEQRSWLAAADFARTRRQNMVDAFRKRFEHRYSLACRRKSALIAGHVLDFDASQLSLVDAHDVLENTLTPAMLAEAIRNGTWAHLHELTKWFRTVMADPELIPNEMPLGPGLIAGAVTDAINDQFGGQEIKQRVLRALCRILPEPVNHIYRDLTGYLHGITPVDRDVDEARFAMDIETPDETSNLQTPNRVSAALPAAAESATEAARGAFDGDVESRTDTADLVANEAASEAIEHRLCRKRLPHFIADFLAGPWRAVLASIHRRHGAFGPEWEDALRTMDDLLHSLRAKPTPEERGRLMGTLPDLVKRLGLKLAILEEPMQSHDRFFAHLAECHIRILGASHPDKSAPTPEPRPAPSPSHAEREQMPEESGLTSLRTGACLTFRQPDGTFKELKLAWISPQRNLFLLTNHLGERALSIGTNDLTDLLRDGGARIVRSPDAAKSNGTIAQVSQDMKSA